MTYSANNKTGNYPYYEYYKMMYNFIELVKFCSSVFLSGCLRITNHLKTWTHYFYWWRLTFAVNCIFHIRIAWCIFHINRYKDISYWSQRIIPRPTHFFPGLAWNNSICLHCRYMLLMENRGQQTDKHTLFLAISLPI